MLGLSRKSLALCGAIGLLSSSPPRFSDPIGCYALIDRVVIQQEGGDATSIQIWGVFALTDSTNGLAPGHGYSYLPAQRGYLYYTMNANPRPTTAEWQDMRSIAGTGQIIGFGGRYEAMGRVRPNSEPPSKPDVYPSAGYGGFVKGAQQWTGNAVVADMYAVPDPISPAEGGRVAPGVVTLTARPVRDTTLRMVFEIESASHAKESSGPMRIGHGNVSWTPKMQLAPGVAYVWRVSTTSVSHDYTSRPATSSFRVTP